MWSGIYRATWRCENYGASLPRERDLWRDLEFRSELVVSLSFVYVGHLAFKFSPSKTAPIKPEMHTRDKHKVNSRYVNFIFSFFDFYFLAKNIRLCMGNRKYKTLYGNNCQFLL